ncbi:tetratricopeptide repeat protein [Pseudorhodoplanes sp.]|uniref:tetratricopeptide repeat protein n=1 Tax=Pseudorhodoplanes sp. TaxID=1934341 RepID=UPI003D0DE052
MLRIFGIVFFGIALVATDADADRYDDCRNEDNTAVVIRGCTEIIQRGARESVTIRASAYNLRGNAHFSQGRGDEAIADYTKAIELAPKNPAHFSRRANAFFEKGDNERAIADYTSAIKFGSRQGYFMRRGQAYAKQEKLDLAAADFTQAIKMSPWSLPYALRAEIEFRRGDVDAAIRDQTTAVGLMRERLWKRVEEANLLLYQSRKAEAIDILREVLADKGTDEPETSAKEEAKGKLEKLMAASSREPSKPEPSKSEPTKQEASKQEASKQEPIEADRIEFGRVYSLELAADPAYSEVLYLQGLDEAAGMRTTISVVSLGRHPVWLPRLLIRVASTPEAIQEKGNTFTTWNFAISGQSPMTVDAEKWQVVGVGKTLNHRVFKRKLRADQSINVDISWATAGKIVFTIDGSEKHEIPLSEPVKYLAIARSTGTFKIDDMIFRKRR